VKRCGVTLDGMVAPLSKSAAFKSLGKSMVAAKDGMYCNHLPIVLGQTRIIVVNKKYTK